MLIKFTVMNPLVFLMNLLNISVPFELNIKKHLYLSSLILSIKKKLLVEKQLKKLNKNQMTTWDLVFSVSFSRTSQGFSKTNVHFNL